MLSSYRNISIALKIDIQMQQRAGQQLDNHQTIHNFPLTPEDSPLTSHVPLQMIPGPSQLAVPSEDTPPAYDEVNRRQGRRRRKNNALSQLPPTVYQNRTDLRIRQRKRRHTM